MKKLLGTTALVALLAAGPALAQDAPPPAETSAPAATTTTVAPAGRFIVLENGTTDWLASNLIGSTVYSGTDENLGKIVDILATDQGQVKAVVIGVGGFLGIGRKDVAVAPETLDRVKIDNGVKLVLATTKEELNTAPEFKTAAQQESDAAKAAAPDTTMPAADPMTPPAATTPTPATDPAAPTTAPAAP
ncbi:PRC-barrel domain-containing protein [Kaistia granuli]|uniref:PRC-barrel domain-containing protein n=1 Tax=Kaistia granuli TaxID=363259 RepID=UPI00037D531D|nr:PRC-barrel domain-containing protein [Kaistia granuli]